MISLQGVFDRQKRYFATGATRSYAWRIEQLDRMGRMLVENEERLQKVIAADFKTAREEYVFETLASAAEAEYQKSQIKSWMEPVEAPVPRFLAVPRRHDRPAAGAGPTQPCQTHSSAGDGPARRRGHDVHGTLGRRAG